MKLLIDSCIQGDLSTLLTDAGFDVVSVATVWHQDPGDIAIL